MATLSIHEELASITAEELGSEGFRLPLVTDENFEIVGEFKYGHLYLHCTPIRRWSKTVYLSFLEAMNAIKVQALANDFTYLYAFLPLRQLKFASMMGFLPDRTFETNKGEPYVLCFQKAGYL